MTGLCLCCVVGLCLMLAAFSHAAEMAFPGRDWEEATPESQGLDEAKLVAAIAWFIEQAPRDGAREMVIVRNGRLLWKGDDIDKRHGVWSCTKSLTSTVLGLLIDDGKCTLDTRAADAVPELASKYPQLTLRHLVTMTSGYRAVGDEPKGDYKHGPSDTPFMPGDPLFAPPGSKYAYWDSAMNLLGLVLTRIAGEPIEQLFKRRIADPIGMDPQAWEWGKFPVTDGPAVNGGSGNANRHIFISAREMARIGHLYLNRGKWNGRQLLADQWIAQATRVQVPATLPLGHPESGIDGRGVYGFNWWVNATGADGQRLWPGAPESTFAAVGFNNNRLFVIPAWNMVIVRLGLDAPNRVISNELWGGLLERIGEAVKHKTVVSIEGQAFHINGRPTYAGRSWKNMKIEGLLLNSRMVQGLFDDLNHDTRPMWKYPDGRPFDADRNTNEFLAATPLWQKSGLCAFTINFQGGSPQGYSREQPWVNSAFDFDTGELREDYAARMGRIIDRADELGMVVILGYLYFGQEPRFKDEAAVIRAIDSATDWVLRKGYTNVLIEINNECNINYRHDVIRPLRVHEMIQRVQQRSLGRVSNPVKRLLVSTSYGGGTIPGDNVAAVADFLLLHGNGVAEPDAIRKLVQQTRSLKSYKGQPILFNEDDHFRFDEADSNFIAAVSQYAGWGYFDFRMKDEGFDAGYQSVPVNWGISTDRKRGFFRLLAEMTGSGG